MNTNEEVKELLTAPKVTLADIEANIAGEHYFTAEEGVSGAELHARLSQANDPFQINPAGHIRRGSTPLQLLTFCVFVLRNGFTVTGESACVSPENFDAELGRKIARQKAVEKIWPLMGYELCSRLASKNSQRCSTVE